MSNYIHVIGQLSSEELINKHIDSAALSKENVDATHSFITKRTAGKINIHYQAKDFKTLYKFVKRDLVIKTPMLFTEITNVNYWGDNNETICTKGIFCKYIEKLNNKSYKLFVMQSDSQLFQRLTWGPYEKTLKEFRLLPPEKEILLEILKKFNEFSYNEINFNDQEINTHYKKEFKKWFRGNGFEIPERKEKEKTEEIEPGEKSSGYGFNKEYSIFTFEDEKVIKDIPELQKQAFKFCIENYYNENYFTGKKAFVELKNIDKQYDRYYGFANIFDSNKKTRAIFEALFVTKKYSQDYRLNTKYIPNHIK